VYKYLEQFPAEIPKEFINTEIACSNVTFKFISPNTGLFRAFPQPRPFFSFKSHRKNYFPYLLGEIEINRKGVAQITLRIPLSIILTSLALFITVVTSNIDEKFTTNSAFFGILDGVAIMIFISVFSIIGFFMEKDDLHDGLIMLKKRTEEIQKQKTYQLDQEINLSNEEIGNLNKILPKMPTPIFGILFFIGGVYGGYFSLIALLDSSKNAILLLLLSIISIIIGIVQFANRNKFYRENYKPKLEKFNKRK
jgi:hypothetical protein